ncbi:FUSC family protein [Dokdonella sp.]|uniref:FUSC family protein n=1 Tax=Dokdonella sp. TaxID=2291710 RepID=UPI001B107792|nr:FUSC family protein [Dokdonella sp.]MBO9663076.1 FUSC family protein [Dokdonella sp.]
MLNTLLELKPRDVPLRVALRNTLAIVLPLALAILAGRPGIGLGMAAGALNTMFIDQPGPYRLRMQRMLLASLASGVSAYVGSLLGAHIVLLALAALLCGVTGGLLVALGPNAGRTGLACMILLVISAATPLDPLTALGPAALIVGGGVLQMLFAIAAWPLQRYRPERQALADVCRQLAASVRGGDDSRSAPPVTQALLDVESLLHGEHRARGGVMETFRVLAELVERIRLELLALHDLHETLEDGDAKRTLARVLEYAARALETIALALDQGASAHGAAAAMEGFDAALGSLREICASGHAPREVMIALARADGLGGQLRAAARNADFAGSRGELRAGAAELRLPAAMRPGNAAQTLRANLTLSSIAFRHALRCGVCLSLAIVGERLAGIPHGYWIPMTAAIVLKPDFAGTFSFGLLRVIGTMLGLVLVTALVHYAFGGVWERVVLVALFAFGFRLLTTVHYGIGVMMLTGLVVLLFTFDGTAPADVLQARGLATAIGSALALVAYVVWPTWEHLRVRPALAAMLDAYRAYFAVLLQGEPDQRAAARTSARAARTNAQASLERLRGEPRRDRALIALAEGVFANANRFIRAGMALEAVTLDARTLPQRDAVLAFIERIDMSLAALARDLRGGTPPQIGSLREEERALVAALEAAATDEEARNVAGAITEAFDRMTDSIDTLAHVLREDGRRAGGASSAR